MSAEVANLLAKRFIARPDVKAIQHSNGAYYPDVDHVAAHPNGDCPGVVDGGCQYKKITRADLEAHLNGKRTLGHYVLSTDSKCKFFCYDLDLRKEGVWVDDLGNWHDFNPREAWLDPSHPSRPWQTIQLRTLAEALASRIRAKFATGTAISYSGAKGLHVYGFCEDSVPQPAADLRAAAIYILEDYKCFEREKNGDIFWKHISDDPHMGFPNIQIEVFPKQDNLDGKDLGNLLRLPLGVNQKTGQQGYFLDVLCGYDTLKEADPIDTLTVMDPWFRERRAATDA